MKLFFLSLIVLSFTFIFYSKNKTNAVSEIVHQKIQLEAFNFDTTIQTVHILVALCDNTYQGIVPVPKGIGNGQHCNTNLYWGCGYGIRTYFKKSNEWQWLKTIKIDSVKLERVIFKHKAKNTYLVADAYNGKYIKECTNDFLNSCAGKLKDTVHINNKIIGINGNAKLLSYIGHNGLMDFELADSFNNIDGKIRDCIILACVSKSYFTPYLLQAKANPLVWTTGLMCPEAYTIHDALTGYVNKENAESIRTRAAAAYSKYHKSCSLACAKRLLVTGF